MAPPAHQHKFYLLPGFPDPSEGERCWLANMHPLLSELLSSPSPMNGWAMPCLLWGPILLVSGVPLLQWYYQTATFSGLSFYGKTTAYQILPIFPESSPT